MSKFSPKKPSGPSASEIREQEKARIDQENFSLQKSQEESRQKLRGRLLSDDDTVDEQVSRKRLLGQ